MAQAVWAWPHAAASTEEADAGVEFLGDARLLGDDGVGALSFFFFAPLFPPPPLAARFRVFPISAALGSWHARLSHDLPPARGRRAAPALARRHVAQRPRRVCRAAAVVSW